MRQRNIAIGIGLGASSAILAALSPACGSSSNTSHSQSTFDASPADAIAHRGPDDAAGDGASASGDDGSVDAPADGAAPTALVRFANWAPDAPAAGFDVCVQPSGSSGGAWTGPLLGTGVPSAKVGAYSKVPPGTYDVRVVAPGDRSCASTAGTAISLPPLAANARATVALMGAVSPSGNNQPAKIAGFLDDASAPQGQAAVRFINGLTGVMAVVFGTGKQSDLSFAAVTGNVPFGTAATALADGGAADSNGYLLLSPRTGGALSAHVAGGESDISTSSSTAFVDGGFVDNPGMNNLFAPGMDVAAASNAAWPGGSVFTVALVNGPNGGAPQLLQCQDNAAPQGSLSDCTTLSP